MRHHLSRPVTSTPALLEARARSMRLSPTDTEAALFRELRGRRLGVAFRRQVPLGRYIVDFLAPEARLVVEVDGGCHVERRRADARRDAWMVSRGYTVIRLDAELVRRELSVAVERVRAVVERLR